ncbi:MAG: J domain-containing protein [Vicinamibacterales bacterium]|nr:J domain-containing protein [Vicinamibacterales bacterium]
MASYYELLDVAPTADLDTIKHAFRREIARYHPDKVQHLGAEFQQMAAERAATLTAAYKTLMDPALRLDYDASLVGAPAVAAPPGPAAPPAAAATPPPPTVDSRPTPPAAGGDPASGRHRFEDERLFRDSIMSRATTDHVRQAVADALGPSDDAAVKGFDLVLVPRGGGGLLRAATPMRVLVRIARVVDGPLASEAWSAAARARLHLTGAPICVLLVGQAIAPAEEISAAIAQQRARQIPGTPKELAVVPVDIRDWTARIPKDAPAAVRRLVDRLQKWG